MQPLVDKYSGAAYQGFNDLNNAINFMIMGGFSLNGIKMHEDRDNVGEPVTDFATKNGITITADQATNEQTDDFDSDTEEKYTDATDVVSNEVHIDGSCLNNGNSSDATKAGIGVYWGPGHKLNISEPITEGKKTSNTAELLSAIKALEQMKTNNINNVVVTSDSRYVVEGITNWIVNWKTNGWTNSNGKGVENKDLWTRLDALNADVKPKWQHIRREFNMCADKLSIDGAVGTNAESNTSVQPVPDPLPREAECAICRQDAVRESLSCSKCRGKVHYKCSGLPNYQIETYRKSSRKFTCELCVVDAGNVNAGDARKSCGTAEAEPTIHTAVQSAVQVSVQSESIQEEVKCIREDVSQLKGCFSNLESEILKIVSRLADENVQMRENACDEKTKAVEKENCELLNQLKKFENREKELKTQMDNMRDKNAKLNSECENLR